MGMMGKMGTMWSLRLRWVRLKFGTLSSDFFGKLFFCGGLVVELLFSAISQKLWFAELLFSVILQKLVFFESSVSCPLVELPSSSAPWVPHNSHSSHNSHDLNSPAKQELSLFNGWHSLAERSPTP